MMLSGMHRRPFEGRLVVQYRVVAVDLGYELLLKYLCGVYLPGC